jgi:hypothetical protein
MRIRAGLKPILKRVTTEHPSWDNVDTKRVREAMARLAAAASSANPAPVPVAPPGPAPTSKSKAKKDKRAAAEDVDEYADLPDLLHAPLK